MNKLILSFTVVMFYIGLSVSALAGTPFQDLCGTTLTSDTQVKSSVESFGGDCTIMVNSGVDLELRNNTITLTASDLIIIGLGSATLEMKDNTFNVNASSTSDMDIDFADGDVELKGNNINTGRDLFITTLGGDIEVKSNTRSDGLDVARNLEIEAYDGGDVEVRSNEIDADGDQTIESHGGDLEVRSNNPFNTSGALLIECTACKVEVRSNTSGVTPSSTTLIGSPCESRSNSGVLGLVCP